MTTDHTHTTTAADRERFTAHADVMRVLSNPMRHEILHRIAGGVDTVTRLAATTGSSKPAVSQHVTVLRAHGFVSAERRGRSVHFTVAYPELAQACALIDGVLAEQAARTTRLLASS